MEGLALLQAFEYNNQKGGESMKRKTRFAVASLLVLSVLSACSTGGSPQTTEVTSNTSQRSQELEVTLTLQVEGKEFASKQVTVTTGTSVYQALSANFEIQDNEGFITEIDGESQNADEGKYWLYQVNGKDAVVGAKDYLLKAGDQVVFEFEKNVKKH